jgi:Ca2+-binding RTX toxin-like protein
MATITGTNPLGETLTGTSANDTITGLGGPDVLISGGGMDTVSGGDGNDTVVINGLVTNGSSFDGGVGTDILELRNIAGTPVTQGLFYPGGIAATSLSLAGSSVISFEKISLNSNAGTVLSGLFFYGGQLFNNGNIINRRHLWAATTPLPRRPLHTQTGPARCAPISPATRCF